MKAISARLFIKSFVVRVLACLLIITLLAPLTIPLAAKAPPKVFVSPKAFTGNLSAPEPFTFSGAAENAASGISTFAFLAEQMNNARSILPTLSLAFSSLSNSSVSSISANNNLSDEKTSATGKNSNSVSSSAPDPVTVESAPSTSGAKNAPVVSPATTTITTTTAKNALATSSNLVLPARKTAFDFDGDNKADTSVWRPSDGTWWVFQSTTQDIAMRQWGATGDRIVPADYDNDGRTDYAVWTPSSGIWSVLQSSNGQLLVQQWGASTDIPVPGDFDGDGKADFAVWRPSTGVWYITKSSDGSWYAVEFGSEQLGDVPVVGDYDGDRKADVAVWRASNGIWYALRSSDNVIVGPQWGGTSDVPVPADYDGDEKTDYAVWRPSTSGGGGEWFILNSTTGAMTYSIFGASAPADVLAPADYDGDQKADIAVWRPSNGIWYIWRSSTSALWEPPLGVAGDQPVPAAFIKQTGANPPPTPIPPQPTVARAALGRARLAPENTTGATNLYSRNFSWGTGLVNLPGRAGMDAGLSLSYNSLVWTKVGNMIVFDADKGNVAPGFRFGFPVIEPVYTDEQTLKPTYLMVTPSGARIELRQTAVSNLYESTDSSYLQLEVIGGGTQEQQQLVLRATDGTQMKYFWKAGAYRCAEVKDSNGNFITVTHDGAGLLRTIKDTLGRIISVSYDNALHPTLITQTWAGGVTHNWAVFSYTTIPISYNFGGLGVAGPANGSSLKVLDRITFTDNSSVRFEYNSWGQVAQVNNHAADTHKLNHVAADYATSTSPDCPRLEKTRSYIENFNLNPQGVAQEVVVHNSFAENQPFSIGGETGTGTLVEVWMDGHPDNLISRTWFHSAGNWAKGLPFATEDLASGVQKRWTRNVWTQDNTSLSYQQNPRVLETKVGDSGSTKRTTISYHPQFGLPNEVREYDGATVKRKTATDYNFSSAYTSRRIIGLASERRLYEGESTLMSKVTFLYDESGFGGAGQTISPIQHDTTNYGASFTVGRGNLTKATRWRTMADGTPESIMTSSTKYNTAGAVVAQITPGSAINTTREVKISYNDSFVNAQYQDEASRNTFAYPTLLTDPDNHSSYIKYRYDIGANVWAKSPAPAGNTTGKIITRELDAIGRLSKETIINTGAYTRYQYFDNQIQSKIFTTITDGAGEAISETWTDGAGRVRRSRTDLLNPAGNWSGSIVEYDILGRVKRSTVPTEIDGNWNPSGDDSARGWLWTHQKYDWKGRVTRKINTDGVDSPDLNNSDILISYEGCGCAGGQVTTIKGEEIFEKDWQGNNPVSLGRRTQKVYADILGRTYKTEVMNWDAATPYTTTVQTFNGRDQVTQSRQYAGAEGSSTYQDASIIYDGHGRLKTQHLPQQNVNTATTYNYNSDDSIQSVVDARGASTNYTYNNRGLVEQISYDPPAIQPPNTTIPDTPTVGFNYDAAGNPIWMTDGLGRVDYEYNQLSQMTAETRQFNESLPNAPMTSNRFRLEYDYTLSGQLKFYKDPYGQKINYIHDKVGRLSSVAGETSFGGVTTYANNPQYRAWGGLKSLNFGNGTQMSVSFNNRLQAAHYEFNKSGQQPIMSKDYDYYSDGSLRKLDDALDDRFDRVNTYDNLGRPKTGKTSAEARGGTVVQGEMEANLPYRQSYEFNAFNNMTQRNNLHWGIEQWGGQSNNLSYGYQNNRITNAGWTYDADGRVLNSSAPDDYIESTYDAKGQISRMLKQSESDIHRYYEGGGREAKRKKLTYVENQSGSGSWAEELKYYIRSSVLGGEVVSEVNYAGKKLKTFVRAAGTVLAWQMINGYDNSEYVTFEQSDASGMSQRTTMIDGSPIYGEGADGAPAELDPMGGNVGLSTPYYAINSEPPPEPQIPTLYPMDDASPTYVNGQRVTATLDGMPIGLAQAMSMMQNGSAIPAALAGFQGQSGFRFDSVGLGLFNVSIPRQVGWNVNYNGANDTRGTASPVYLGSNNFTVSFNVSWTSQQQTQQSIQPQQTRVVIEPLPPLRTKTNIEKLTAALDTCIRKLFGVSLTSFIPSGKGKNGNVNVNFIDPNKKLRGGAGFGVVNDITTYSRGAARAEVNAIRKSNGEPPLEKNSILYGFTNSDSPHTNFTANDEKSAVNILKTQIHELGHSLEYIARPAVSGFTQYKEAGWDLENCVVGEGGFKP
ncbi:MAG: VCBS repeat-containing protein [Pyrinomonadaceae bacterium]